MRSAPLRRIARLLAVSSALAGSGFLAAPAAHADPLADAQARAAALADSVDALQKQTEAATERYNLVAGQLAAAASKHSQALTAVGSAQRTLNAQQSVVANRARALYISGGDLALIAQALQSDTPRILADRIVFAQRVTLTARSDGTKAKASSTKAGASLARAAKSATLMAQLQRKASVASGRVALLLQKNQDLLANADAQVTAIEAQIEAQRAAAAAASFNLLLVQARADAGSTAVTGSAGDDVPAGPLQAAAVTAIQTRLGTPYQWGGTGPDSYDCSGLTGYAYWKAGLTLPRTAAQQYLAGPHPDLADLRAGDLLFWATDTSNPATIHHVAMYAGGGLMWSDNDTGDTARLQEIWGADEFVGATRPDPAMAAAVSPPFWSGS
jgi:cell wall-associated NlpC family hydrolase